ncbi:MAG: FAD binding domain-containing protein [Acidobacteria bacterium]|uniref:FAD binding domain-containing protein n=1 Tax=Candidatus Polarisedimenticola svalbardensis TaxID=2886004 RepID=A0A8J6XYY8_9BACT|nr:FAD binding domain-containing protein [Candidatus Polarisedimenticola svalbardensis]
MLRLPRFRYMAPTQISEAARILASEGADAMLLAGGTDLFPNMKRRQQTPATVVALRDVERMREIGSGHCLTIGAGITLTEIVQSDLIRSRHAGLWQAAAQVASPQLRNMATVGGNLCLDTRCNYYDQTLEWRKAIDFCMKKDGEVCWVAPGSPKCLAVSSTDTAPALVSLRAKVKLTAADGDRMIRLEDLYANDGIHYLTKDHGEILTLVELDQVDDWKSTYWKLRRRGSIDFPVLGVAASAKFADDGTVENCRVVLGAVSSAPIRALKADAALIGNRLSDDVIAQAAEAGSKVAKPMDNTDFTLHWRKKVAARFVTYALRELRGDDMREMRSRVARHDLEAVGV